MVEVFQSVVIEPVLCGSQKVVEESRREFQCTKVAGMLSDPGA